VASHRADDAGELFGITELCAEFDITLRTIASTRTRPAGAAARQRRARLHPARPRAAGADPAQQAIGASLQEIKHYLDMYGAHGEGRVQQLNFVRDRTDGAIRALEQKRAHIDATLAELRLINATVRKQLESK